MLKTDIAELEHAINTLTGEGKILESLDRYYADHCTFQEGVQRPIVGKSTQQERLKEMFAGLKSFNGATLHGETSAGDVSMSEWTFDMTGGDGEPILWNEVLVRRWEDGLVVSERYYQA